MVQFHPPSKDTERLNYALSVGGTKVQMLLIVQVEVVTTIADISTQIMKGNLWHHRRPKLRPGDVRIAELLDVKESVVINTAQIKSNTNYVIQIFHSPLIPDT